VIEFNTFAIIILVALFAFWKLDLLATLLNLKSLDPRLPDAFADVYDADTYARSQSYTRASASFGVIRASFSLTVLLGFWLLGGFGWLDHLVRSFGFGEVPTGLAFIGLMALGGHMLNLPFSIYDTFVLEERFGFNKTTPKTFAADQIKGLLLAVVLGAPLLAAILWIFISVAYAWLWAWLVFTGFQLLLTYLAPTFILPIFNKFQPMPEGELKSAIREMADRCDFPLTEIFVMDGSKRSTKANAFFTGFGKRKKIALFDTLIEKQTTPELVAVLAHEIGHFKRKHIVQRIGVGILQSAVIFFLLGLFTTEGPFARELFAAFGVAAISPHVGLVLFGILFSPISRLLGIAANAWSRKHEFEADAYAADAMGSPAPLASALKKLSAENLSNLTPHRLRVVLDYSHPPVMQRLQALEARS
jgi:STE24 endopeptidase